MSKKIHEFNDIIRKLRKELFGKGLNEFTPFLWITWRYLHFTAI